MQTIPQKFNQQQYHLLLPIYPLHSFQNHRPYINIPKAKNIKKPINQLSTKKKNNEQKNLGAFQYSINSPRRQISTAHQKKTIQATSSRQLNIINKQKNRYSRYRKYDPAIQIPRTIDMIVDEDLLTLNNLLENYNFKGYHLDNYERMLRTYGLKINSFKSNVQPIKRQKFSLDKQKVKHQRQRIFVEKIDKKIKRNQSTSSNQIILEQINKTVKNERTFKENNKVYYSSLDSKPIKLDKLDGNTTLDMKFQTRDIYKHLRYGQQRDHFNVRLNKYKDHLFIVNFSNRMYRQLDFNEYYSPILFYIGKGNNANLIRSIIKKRFWFNQTNTLNNANFVWTQIKINQIFQRQSKSIDQSFKSQFPIFVQPYQQIQNIANLFKKGSKKFQPSNPLLKLLSKDDLEIYNKLALTNKTAFNDKLKIINQNQSHKIKFIKQNQISTQILHNHLPLNGILGNKKSMFYCLKQYCKLSNNDIFKVVPYTIHITKGIEDLQFQLFQKIFSDRQKQNKPNIWILKPGQFTNRGTGIICTDDLNTIKQSLIKQQNKHTLIIQQYITRPLLYNHRKFDIRAFILITSMNGVIKGYWYQQGYIRTSSHKFQLNKLKDPMVHLTNDAIQQHGQNYSKYQEGNKLSYGDLQRYLQLNYKHDFYNKIYPQLKKIAIDSIRSAALFLDQKNRQHNFEILGLDFMIDDKFKPWLIQINTNPCLQINSGVLCRIIPCMIQNAFRIAVDATFPPPNNFPSNQRYYISQNSLFYNRFQLVYDELRDRGFLQKLYKNSKILQEIGNSEQKKEGYIDLDERIQEGDQTKL